MRSRCKCCLTFQTSIHRAIKETEQYFSPLRTYATSTVTAQLRLGIAFISEWCLSSRKVIGGTSVKYKNNTRGQILFHRNVGALEVLLVFEELKEETSFPGDVRSPMYEENWISSAIQSPSPYVSRRLKSRGIRGLQRIEITLKHKAGSPL